MKFTLVAAVALAVSGVSAFTVNTPVNVVECQPVQLTWDATGATPPYFLSVHPGSDPTGTALFSWSDLTGTSFTWSPVPIAGGTSLSLLLRDTAGNTVQSAIFTVQAGTDSSCLNGTTSTGTGTTTTPATGTSTTPATGTTTTPATGTATTPSTGTTTSTTKATTSGTSTTSGSTPSSSSGAINNVVRVGFAGAIAAVVAVFLA